MQPIHLYLALTCLSGLALGQVNPFVFYPQDPERQTVTCTSYVGRPDSNRDAEALMQFDEQDFRGVGDANGVTRLFGVYHWVADENLATVETYDLVVRRGTAAGGPDMTSNGELLTITNLTTPPSVNPQRGTWIMYDGFGVSGGLLYLQSQATFVGVHLPANPLWPASDGHSLFRADMLGANTAAVVGENERLGAPNPTWAGKQGAPSFSTPWTYILGPFVTSPNLHMGGTDPSSSRLGASGASFGMNGLYPDIGGSPRSDGLVARVTDNLAPFGWAFLGGSLGFQFPFYLGNPVIGISHIGGPGYAPIVLGLAPLQNGAHEFTMAMPGTIPVGLVGQYLVFQAVVFDANLTLGEWTDAQAVHF